MIYHLGSTSWITDDNAQPVQYIHYAPFGELLANQRATSFDERYKFTGKERDAESSYDNFGARYWWSSGGHWLSVDPLADKNLDISPYAYCAWNPIKFIDPDGREATISYVVSKKQERKEREINEELIRRSEISSLNTINNDYTFVWAHGSEDGTSVEYAVMSAKSYGEIDYASSNFNSLNLYNVLIELNASFKKDPNNAVVIFASCNTGRGEGSIASEFSKLTPTSIIIAPSEKVTVDKKGNIRVNNNGHWNVFMNGKVVDTIQGSKGALEKYLQENGEKEALLQKYVKSSRIE